MRIVAIAGLLQTYLIFGSWEESSHKIFPPKSIEDLDSESFTGDSLVNQLLYFGLVGPLKN